MPTDQYTLSQPADILVVDDTIDSLRLLTDILTNAGYRVRPAERSPVALESALAQTPSLILLDVKMPEMDGFEVCRHLKQDERTRDVPIIFISALQDLSDRIEGFEAGGVDFVSKPFQKLEVLARVKIHLRLYHMQSNLEGMVAERTLALEKEMASHKESESRFRATFEQAAVGIAHVAPEGHFLRINQKFCDIVGYSQKEMLEVTFQDITHPDDLETDLEKVNKLLEGELETYSMGKRYFHKNGAIVWVNLTVSLLRTSAGEPDYFIAVIEEITDKIEAENRIQESEERFRNLMEESPLSIQIFDKDGRIVEVNKTWMNLWNINEEDLPAVKEKYNILHDEEAAKRGVIPLIERVFKGEVIMLPEIEYESAGAMETIGLSDEKAKSIWLKIRFYPIKDEEGNIKDVISIEEDITEHKQAEEKIHRHQLRLKTLASQLAIVEEKERRRIAEELHDHIGQTLAFIRIQIAKAKKYTSDGMLATLLDEISQSMLGTIQDTKALIFDLSSPLLNELGLATAIEHFLENQVWEKYGIITAFIDNSKKKELTNDLRAILFRNVRELLSNSIKHANATKIVVTMESQGPVLKIIVHDNGSGFDPQGIENYGISEMKFGLFSIKERMSDLGGSLEIISKPEKGCQAILSIPF
ncbi:MAG: PAS domain S-box protein [Bacteroides sp.]|nr:PAS domain S-box protein [Bacteroides sp.]